MGLKLGKKGKFKLKLKKPKVKFRGSRKFKSELDILTENISKRKLEERKRLKLRKLLGK